MSQHVLDAQDSNYDDNLYSALHLATSASWTSASP
jgi:hypothetical protein